MISVYIHVPFCHKICTYCDFCKFIYHDKWVKSYLKALEKEINEKYVGDEVKTLYIGGGTPSALKSEDLEKLFNIIKKFNLNAQAEVTIECNLNDINEEFLKIIIAGGVNRLSIGIESFDQNNLAFLGRKGSFKKAQEKIKLCHKFGLKNLNVDLIYALPNETIKVLKSDLKKIKRLNITHVSTYSLMIEENTILSYQKVKPISENIDFKMYQIIIKNLKKAGFKHYEISNFAKKGYESKHNLVYWNNENYYGFGPGASGYLDSMRYDNTRSLTKYFAGDFIDYKEKLDLKMKMDYEIMLGLRKTSGINIDDFQNKYHVDIKKQYPIDDLLKCKDLIYKKGNIFINPKKLYVMNEIIIKLI